jgi:hypothetical protein
MRVFAVSSGWVATREMEPATTPRNRGEEDQDQKDEVGEEVEEDVVRGGTSSPLPSPPQGPAPGSPVPVPGSPVPVPGSPVPVPGSPVPVPGSPVPVPDIDTGRAWWLRGGSKRGRGPTGTRRRRITQGGKKNQAGPPGRRPRRGEEGHSRLARTTHDKEMYVG